MRLRVFRRLYDDNFLVILAWLIQALELLYESYHISYAGVLPSTCYLEHLSNWLRILFASLFLNLVRL